MKTKSKDSLNAIASILATGLYRHTLKMDLYTRADNNGHCKNIDLNVENSDANVKPDTRENKEELP